MAKKILKTKVGEEECRRIYLSVVGWDKKEWAKMFKLSMGLLGLRNQKGPRRGVSDKAIKKSAKTKSRR